MHLQENKERFRIKNVDLDILEIAERESQVTLELTKTGDNTGHCTDRFGERFYLHSKYNPKKEAAQFVSTCTGKGKVVVYGFGLGYHIKTLIEMDYTEIVVIDGNPLGLLSMLDVENMEYVEDDRLHFILTFDRELLIKELSNFLEEGVEFLIHPPSLRLLEKNSPDIVELLREFNIQRKGKRDNKLQENLTYHLPYIRGTPNIGSLLSNKNDLSKPKRGIIIAAGPSLNHDLDTLKELPENTLVIAVGTAVRPLYSHGVIPDLIIIIDPDPLVGKQLEGLKINVPLIIFPTTHPFSYRDHKGEVWFAFQKGVYECELLAQELKVPCLETGGSVATAALDLCIQLNCNPIIFVGQDLASQDGRTHAAGTMYDGRFININQSKVKVEAWGGGYVSTSISWNVYRKWIERRLAKSPAIMAINASTEGARIKGTIEMSLRNALLIPPKHPLIP
ncbi:motility associated factor glycosyltransferase family protein [Brevibacillus invocatus]|uniref:motility associated factor glycosyltransferase family protein n=1 Tax=Brevibacillus invocatus TaxID=173959 RepID=UPI0020417215|nr:6-hydroxymethylpterin diphosphokinase MptE-like protein [Brevibacillus invocatus]MCM3079660.1 DUF115 domain-containing protein [Brevibacillus invocatus]MCM3431130.1 DUF115 domain-containing protein [Brevibacillus invocatus]